MVTIKLYTFLKFDKKCVFAEWVEVGIWDTWLNLFAGRRHSRSLWMWIPWSSASSGHWKKSSNLSSSAILCCLVLCFLLGGPLILWWESKRMQTSWACSWTSSSLLKLIMQNLVCHYKLLVSSYTTITPGVIMFLIWFMLQYSLQLLCS